MTAMKKTRSEKLLTDVELELMNVIWTLGECTVKEVQNALTEERDLAYTSVATIMKILEQKKVLASHKKEKAHTYHPLLSKADYEGITLRHVARHVFRGDSSSMMVRLLDETELSSEELKAIRRLLDERLKS